MNYPHRPSQASSKLALEETASLDAKGGITALTFRYDPACRVYQTIATVEWRNLYHDLTALTPLKTLEHNMLEHRHIHGDRGLGETANVLHQELFIRDAGIETHRMEGESTTPGKKLRLMVGNGKPYEVIEQLAEKGFITVEHADTARQSLQTLQERLTALEAETPRKAAARR